MPGHKEDAGVIQFLMQQKIITARQLQDCQLLLKSHNQQEEKLGLLDILVRQKYVRPEQVAMAQSLSQLPADTVSPAGGIADRSMGETLVVIPNQPGNDKNFGRYQIVKELGHGGMGVVYHAYDPSLKRHVALKIMHQLSASDKERKRFLREIELMAKLNHPNIVRVFDTGEEMGRLFFTMEMVEGNNLTTLLKDNTPLTRLVQIMLQVTQAVHYAHQQGVIHRDLKPSNIMVTNQGEAKVMDFGLAKETSKSGDQLSKSQDVLGTPEYMSPEQAAGKSRMVDMQSDVYSLGAVLYEMLTGRPPFTGPTPMSILYKITCEEPRPPSRVSHHVSPDLEAICLKALEKDKAKRYKTAQELYADLDNYSQGKPIIAKPITAVGRAWRLARRYRLVSVGASLIVVLLLSAVVFFVHQQRQMAQKETKLKEIAEQKRREAEQNWQAAEKQKLAAEQQKQAALQREIEATLSQAEAELILAKTWINQRNYFAAQERQKRAENLLERVGNNIAPNGLLSQTASEFTKKYLALRQAGSDMRRYVIDVFMPRHESIEFSMRALVPAQPSPNLAALSDASGHTIIWDMRQQKEIKRFAIIPMDCGVTFSADDKWIAVGGAQNKLVLWNRIEDKVSELSLQPEDNFIWLLQFSPDQKWLLVGSAGMKQNANMLLDLANPREPLLLRDADRIYTGCFSNKGDWLAVSRREHSMAFFDLLRQGKDFLTPADNRHFLPAERICFGPQDMTLISSYLNDILIQPLGKTSLEDRFNLVAAHRGKLMDVELSPDHQLLFSAGEDGRLVCWNTYDYGKMWETTLRGQLRNRASIGFIPGKKEMTVWTTGATSRYTWENDVTFRLNVLKRSETKNKLAAETFRNLQRNHVTRNMSFALANFAFSRNGQYLACYTYPNLFLWHMASDSIRHLHVYPRAFDVEERELVFGHKDETVLFGQGGKATLFDTATGKIKMSVDERLKEQFWLLQDGRMLTTWMMPNGWDVGIRHADGQPLQRLFSLEDRLAMIVDRQGNRLAVARMGISLVDIWNIPAAKKTATLTIESQSNCTSIIFLDEWRLALGMDNGDLTICDIRTSKTPAPALCSFFAPIRQIWHQPDAHLYWVLTNNGIYVYPDNIEPSQRDSINQIYPLPLLGGYPLVTCAISHDFRYMAALMQSGELLVLPLPAAQRH